MTADVEHRKQVPSRRELLTLLIIYAAGFGLLAIRPYDRWDWALENFFPLAQLLALAVTYRHFKFTRLSYYLIFFYLFVQSYGGHYTYALAPPFNWLRDEFHLSRNHYDRVAHFMLGFLLAIPIREILLRSVKTSRRWMAFITAAIVLAIGAFYEFIEWWVALLSSPELGNAFLGTQGDIWDSHWDMFLALVGAVCALALFMKLHDKQLGAYRRSKQTPD
ncbi:MAG: putative rane protein [Blastocatellia bacterium]|jgi:putative membrane protein|nr:putative rane protein [Blastocatellia bacterium]